MKIKYRLYVTVGLIALISLGGCGREDAPVVLESLTEDAAEHAAGPDGAAETAKAGSLQDETAGDKQVAEETGTVKVHVCGAVADPGVYELPADARIADALLAAGDFLPDADIDHLNQAALLTDGQQIYVPTEEETAAGIVPAGESAATGLQNGAGNDGLLDINTATVTQLKTLPGIGDVKANAIVSYRERNGKFSSIEEIQQVEGIKAGLYSQICDKICVR
ncbi:MAG: ComEA family DNA-binding protein [Lachnospiraceae bacterium]|nr:ComEA family DNA-binding protein [Lachnospiraceae bacterium]